MKLITYAQNLAAASVVFTQNRAGKELRKMISAREKLEVVYRQSDDC